MYYFISHKRFCNLLITADYTYKIWIHAYGKWKSWRFVIFSINIYKYLRSKQKTMHFYCCKLRSLTVDKHDEMTCNRIYKLLYSKKRWESVSATTTTTRNIRIFVFYNRWIFGSTISINFFSAIFWNSINEDIFKAFSFLYF